MLGKDSWTPLTVGTLTALAPQQIFVWRHHCVSARQWCHILPNTDNVDLLVEEWTTRFNFVVEKHATMRVIRVSDKYRP